MLLLTLLAAAVDAHTIAVVLFIVTMVLWLFAGIEWTGETPIVRRIGGGLVPWLAVATLAYMTLG